MERLTVFLDEPSNEGFIEKFVIAHPFLFGLLMGTGSAGLVCAIWEVTLKWLG